MATPERRRTEQLHRDDSVAEATAARPARQAYQAYQAYRVLLWAFTVLPIVAGVDKFFDFLVEWDRYLMPAIPRLLRAGSHPIMMVIGAVEIVAGIIVALRPTVGAWVVAAWLWGIVLNLISIPGYLDIAARDLALSLGAVALARLAAQFETAAGS